MGGGREMSNEEVIKLLSGLKAEIHNHAVYSNIRDIDGYVKLKEIDAVIASAMHKLFVK
jgi:hypothetical protein